MSIKSLVEFTPALVGFLLTSCSLNYNKNAAHFDKKPNMVFTNITLDRYEEKKLNLKVISEQLEIYDSDKIWAGCNIYFSQFDKSAPPEDKKLDFKGFSGAVLINENKDEYYLGKEVYFEAAKDGIIISSPALYWLKKDSMLFSPENALVTIQKENEVFLSGKGFSANTLSKEYLFSDSVSGRIETKDNSTSEVKDENQTGTQKKLDTFDSSLLLNKSHGGILDGIHK